MYLSGHVAIVGDAATIGEAELPGVQGRLLVATLALERRPVARDVVSEWLWPLGAATDSAKRLNPLISKIRQQFARLGPVDAPSIRSASGCLELVLPPDSWIDIEDAVGRLDRAEGALRHGEPDTAWADAAVAVSILRRGLLPGCDSEWVDRRRVDLDDRLHRGWMVLGTVWMARGDHALARSAAQSAIGVDPYREDAHRLLVRVELACGNRALAARALERCHETLRELGVGPSDETRDLEAAIAR